MVVACFSPSVLLPLSHPPRPSTTTTTSAALKLSFRRCPATSPAPYSLLDRPSMSTPTRRLPCLAMAESNPPFSDFVHQEHCNEGRIQCQSDEADDVKPQISLAQSPRDETITLGFIEEMIADFRNQTPLDKKYAYAIVKQATDLLRPLPSLVDVIVPDGKHLTVCGDLHGQFYDLLHIFELNGLPSESNPYIFNGDFVDRGLFSVEVILTLFAFKCMCPSAIYLTRGNHESIYMNMEYGFHTEVESKLGEEFIEQFDEAFRCLPLAYVINRKVFVVHGGLPTEDGVKLSDIRGIDRFREPPTKGLMCELLWNDPGAHPGRGYSMRGIGYTFGVYVLERFLQDNNLELVVRSHEVRSEGYEVEHDGKLITVFSASNYCGMRGNKGAFIRFAAPEMKPDIVTFIAQQTSSALM